MSCHLCTQDANHKIDLESTQTNVKQQAAHNPQAVEVDFTSEQAKKEVVAKLCSGAGCDLIVELGLVPLDLQDT